MEIFEKIERVSPDPIFGLMQAFKQDPRENKVNLVAGVYQTADLKPLILNTVKKVEQQILESETSKDYLQIDGLPEYVEETQKLVFNQTSKNIYGAQTVGGTAALRLGFEFLKSLGCQVLYFSDPTWANHRRIFHHAGITARTYPYFDMQKKVFDFEGMLAALDQMEKGSIVLLHACCHNPTGLDPTFNQWEEICKKMKQKELFPFFDFAYQGFGEDLDYDAASIRLFLEEEMEFAVAVSHSKNFGLYAERCGALYMVCHSSDQAKRAGASLKAMIRGMYSNPPCHGARIVSTILAEPVLKGHWLTELASMRERIRAMRKSLIGQLQALASSNLFDFLEEQKGMFSFTGLQQQYVDRLLADYGIYMPKDGRINVSGLNTDNLHYVAEAIIATVGASI